MAECIFCGIVAGGVPAKKAYEDERVVAFHDVDPKAPTHVLVIPKRHVASVDALGPADEALAGHLLWVAGEVARREGVSGTGYRVVVNNGADGLQSVDHIHLHVMGGRRMTWPPG